MNKEFDPAPHDKHADTPHERAAADKKMMTNSRRG